MKKLSSLNYKQWTEESLKEHFKQIRKDVLEFGTKAKGQKEFLKFLEGGVLSLKQSLLANCYQCMGYYEDMGLDKDCRNRACPSYFHFPYKSEKRKIKTGKPMSEEHKNILKKALEKARRNKQKKVLE
jgi:hypothetical protein